MNTDADLPFGQGNRAKHGFAICVHLWFLLPFVFFMREPWALMQLQLWDNWDVEDITEVPRVLIVASVPNVP